MSQPSGSRATTGPARRRPGSVLIVLVTTLLGLVIGFAAALMTDEQWLVSAKVLLQIGPETGGARPSMVGSPAPMLAANPRREDVQTEVELLTNPDLIRRAFQRLLQENPEGALGRESNRLLQTIRGLGESLALLPRRSRSDRALDKWASNLRVAVVPASTVLKLECPSPRPEAAARLLELLLDLYRSDHISAFGSRDLPHVLGEFVSRSDETLAAAEAALGKLRVETGIIDVPQESSLLLKQRSEAETRLVELTGKVAGARARVAALDGLLKATPVEHRVSADHRPNPTHDELELRLATARQEYAVALQQYAETSPQVRVAREVLKLLTELTAKAEATRESSAVMGRSNVYDLLLEALNTATAEEKAGAAELEAVRTTTKSLSDRLIALERARPALEKAERDVLEAKKALTSAHEGSRLARMEQLLDSERVANIAVVGPPTWLPTPLRKFGLPTRLALSLAGLFAGLGLGVTLVLWRRGPTPPASARAGADPAGGSAP